MRVERAWAVVLFVVGAVLCFVPLFDVLGYEWSLVMALLASLAGAHLGAVRVWRERRERAPSAVTTAEARPGATVAALWWGATRRLWAALLLPLLAILGNALRVRNCDVWAGIGWFVMLPMLSAAMGAGAGVVAGLLRAWRGRVAPVALAIAIVVASIAWGVWRFYAAPPIFGYDPFVGYFAGTLYDEEVAITRTFAWARLYHVALLAGWLALCALLLDSKRLKLSWPTLRARPLVCAIVALSLAASLWHARATLGFAYSAGDIAKRLGGELRTAHFVLHYSPSGPFAKEIAVYAEDDEFRWHELEEWFGRAPAPPVHAFLFDSVAQKRALMGAAHTFIAKPWRREIYLQHDAWPQEVTKHELAHVFGGPFGDPIFGIARHGLQFNVGLIEGLAVAAAWPGNQALTPHQIVKVLRDAKLVDERTLGSVMGPRFFGINAAQAYNVAGSFCRFLAETRGADKLERVYRAAGAGDSWREIYGVSFDALRDEWLKLIDAQTVPANERAVALERLKRPSVFRRVCAHAQALRKQAAREAAQAGDRARALAEWNAVCAEDDAPENALDRIEAMLAAGDYASAEAALGKLGPVDDVHRARVAMLGADIAVLRGGDGNYDAMAALPLEESTARLVTAKREISHWPAGDARTQLLQILAAPAGTRDVALDLATMQKLTDAHPERALLHYLLGRQLYARGRFADAADELARALAGTLPDARFSREARRMRGAALFRAGKRDEARALFTALADDRDAPEATRLDAREWIGRTQFKMPP